MKKEFHQAYESMKPINLIKSTFKEVAQSQEIKDNLINTGVGLAAGYVSKALFEGVTHSPLRKLLGTALMFGITNVITKNPEAVKTVTNGIFVFIKSKFTEKETEPENNKV
jgi:F0F1-type ATP synthase membrane subunit c/vacuolar-type H+-ATPase subunit K